MIPLEALLYKLGENMVDKIKQDKDIEISNGEIENRNVRDYPTNFKNPTKIKQGKKNRNSGSAFELKVRKDLESKGWIVSKWMNNVEFEKGSVVEPDKPGTPKNSISSAVRSGILIQAKHKFQGIGRPMAIGTGFPDFIAFKFMELCPPHFANAGYDIFAVECKSNGYLDKVEKEKIDWLLSNCIFSKFLIAMKDKNKRGGIIYKEYEKNLLLV